jgi:hypothetical protein
MRYTLSWRDSFLLKITVSIPLAAWNRAFHIFTPNYDAALEVGGSLLIPVAGRVESLVSVRERFYE